MLFNQIQIVFGPYIHALRLCLARTNGQTCPDSILNHSSLKLSYKLNCTPDYMTIEVNVTGYEQPFVYLEKLKSFSICRPKIVKSIAYFHLALDDNFYRCGTTKIHDQVSGTRIYYNRVLVEDKKLKEPKSIYFKCSLPNISKILGNAPLRPKRQLVPSGPGQLVNFTEIDLPDNFMEAEILDFDQNITARAPYPNLNIKVKRNGQFVNTSLNVAPGTPLEMIIYLDDESKHVYGLLASFMKVTDNGAKQKEEVIVLNGCSIDPYIFGNFETFDNGDSVSAKFRAFKFPESNYVMFVGTVNVCLDQCKGVPCGNDIVAYGKRRRRRSIPIDIPKDVNKVYEIEMITYLQIGYGDTEKVNEKLTGTYINESNGRSPLDNYSKLTSSAQTGHVGSAIPITSRLSNGGQQFKQSIISAMYKISAADSILSLFNIIRPQILTSGLMEYYKKM
ncbi:hypothetical protein BLOT_001425 [Blomia tropicalis]|nr:hypothetical protein BLOT_001425 [Blomia tropicalis]